MCKFGYPNMKDFHFYIILKSFDLVSFYLWHINLYGLSTANANLLEKQ